MTEAEQTDRRGWETYGGATERRGPTKDPAVYKTHNGGELWHGDALDLIAKLPEFTCVFTDPPYCSGGRQTNQARRVVSKNKNVSDENWIDGDNMGAMTYQRWLRDIGALLYERAAPIAEFFIMTDWRQLATVEYTIESSGWRMSNVVVWIKSGGLGSRFMNCHELVVYFNKGNAGVYTGTMNHWKGPKPRNKQHPNEKPVGLIKHCIQEQPGQRTDGERTGPGLIVDPFVGSGSTIIAAQQLGFPVIGIERNGAYLQMAQRRMREEGHEWGRLFDAGDLRAAE